MNNSLESLPPSIRITQNPFLCKTGSTNETPQFPKRARFFITSWSMFWTGYSWVGGNGERNNPAGLLILKIWEISVFIKQVGKFMKRINNLVSEYIFVPTGTNNLNVRKLLQFAPGNASALAAVWPHFEQWTESKRSTHSMSPNGQSLNTAILIDPPQGLSVLKLIGVSINPTSINPQ